MGHWNGHLQPFRGPKSTCVVRQVGQKNGGKHEASYQNYLRRWKGFLRGGRNSGRLEKAWIDSTRNCGFLRKYGDVARSYQVCRRRRSGRSCCEETLNGAAERAECV